MRYVIEFLVPAMVVIVVALVLFRNRPPDTPAPAVAPQTRKDNQTLSTGTFILIILIGAVFTVALVWALHIGS